MLHTPVSRLLVPLRPAVMIGRVMNLHWTSSSYPATPAPAGALSKLARIDNQMHHIELSLQKWMDSLWRGHVLTHHAPFEPERPGHPWDTEIEMDFTNLIEPEIVKEGNDVKYRMSVDMGDDIPPENVRMTLKDRKIKIHVKLDAGDETTTHHPTPGTYREVISRPFALPRHIDENSVRSVMGPHGIFQIEILIPKKVVHDIEKAQKSKHQFHVGME